LPSACTVARPDQVRCPWPALSEKVREMDFNEGGFPLRVAMPLKPDSEHSGNNSEVVSITAASFGASPPARSRAPGKGPRATCTAWRSLENGDTGTVFGEGKKRQGRDHDRGGKPGDQRRPYRSTLVGPAEKSRGAIGGGWHHRGGRFTFTNGVKQFQVVCSGTR